MHMKQAYNEELRWCANQNHKLTRQDETGSWALISEWETFRPKWYLISSPCSAWQYGAPVRFTHLSCRMPTCGAWVHVTSTLEQGNNIQKLPFSPSRQKFFQSSALAHFPFSRHCSPLFVLCRVKSDCTVPVLFFWTMVRLKRRFTPAVSFFIDYSTPCRCGWLSASIVEPVSSAFISSSCQQEIDEGTNIY